MKIKLLISIGGPGGQGRKGDIIEWENEDAKRLIEAGYAIPVSTPKRTAKKKMNKVEKRDDL